MVWAPVGGDGCILGSVWHAGQPVAHGCCRDSTARCIARVVRTLPESIFLPGLLPGGPAAICWRRSAKARRVSLRIDATKGQVVVTLPMRAGRAAGMALL